MGNIYQIIPLKKQSFFQKLFKQEPRENAIIELNNLLATKSIAEISFNEVNIISSKYKINLPKVFPKNINELYAASLNFYLQDKKLSNQEIEDLKLLKQFLGLNESQIENIHNQIVGKIYSVSYENAISDGRLTDEEELFLKNLKNELKLSDEIEVKISEDVRKNYFNNFVQNAIKDERLTPDEEKEMEAICKSLNIETKVDENSQRILDRYKLYWVLENGEIPTIDVDLNLQRGEICYFKSFANWYEYRAVTKRIDYGGPTAKIKIMKGVYYRVGSVKVNRVTSNELKLINSGDLYLTNKRLIFSGNDKNSTIKLEKVLSFTPYSDGVEIEKETGKIPTIMFNNNVDIFCIVLSRLLKEQ
jgi:hypothetical protein